MNYYELSFTYTSALDTETINDILASELGEIGFESFVPGETGLLGYIPVTAYNPEQLREKLAAFPLENVSIRYMENLVEDKNWNEEWEKNYFQPIRIGHECLIRASFHKDEPGYAYPILIDPKMAFGTGNHETTYLMIEHILQTDLSGKEVLDMGCGTAVLAILARMKGARRVVAIDIDRWAYENAQENIRLNGVDAIEVRLGGAEQMEGCGPFDLIFANINRNILLADISRYAEAMKPGASLYMSGFYTEDLPLIEAECLRRSLTPFANASKNNWSMLEARKGQQNLT